MRKNVWLKSETAKLLNKARLKYIEDTKNTKITDDMVINKALGVYLQNGRGNNG